MLAPLVLGVVVYWFVWSGFRDGFARDIAAVLPDNTPSIGGFPYRLEAELDAPRLRYASPGLTATLSAARGVLNRGPWRPELTVLSSPEPRVMLAVPPLTGTTLKLSATSGLSSLHLTDRRIDRLSNVFESARVESGLFDVPLTASKLEVHFRETPMTASTGPGPRSPTQAQVVVSGKGVKFWRGDPLTLVMDVALTAAVPIGSYAGWAAGGTAEIRATLADASGEVLALAATAVPGSKGALQLAGTVTTVCPNSVRALFAGAPAPSEQRARMPLRLAFSGPPGALTLADPVPAPHSVRGQLPACPVLAR